ncbi:MAG TPA: HAMP domain-containing sensor histidine kinase [Dongiaceae bacterium]|nr:HAMP domain-containing sensor histidine kinase [Dongiaceae bacterium]
MRITRFLRTTTFRLALVYAAVFSLSVILLFGFVYWTASVLVDRQRQQAIIADINDLKDEFSTLGLPGLLDSVMDRSRPDRVGNGVYLLADPHFQPMAGNLAAWPSSPSSVGRWLNFPIEARRFNDAKDTHAIAEALEVALPGGYHLLVGQNTMPQRRMQVAIIEALVWSLAAMVCLGLAGGLLLSRNMIRRIELINRSAERIMRGEVKHRIPVSQANDEFDRLSENLNRMLEEIERLVGGIRAVTDNIAHDLRSPLTRLKNRLEMALAESGGPGERRAAIERAIQETDQLLATFAALLSIADAESGARRGDMAPVDLGEVASDVVELYQPVAEEHGLTLNVSGRGIATVQGNRQLLLQAVANLIDNAVKYSAGGSRIQVEVAAQPVGASISVADYGPGIPAAERGHVLERFVRLDASRTTPGSGLGLSLVAAIARQHGASLELTDTQAGASRPGLTAILRFPSAGSQPAVLQTGTAEPPALAPAGQRSRPVHA